MTVTTYKLSFDPRQLVKVVEGTTPTAEVLATIDPTHDIDILNPTFIVANDADVLTSNYLKCAELGRYYFIDSISVMTGRRLAVKCSVDVLQTYANEIKNCSATVIRTATPAHPTMYTDNKLPVYPSKKIITSITSAETSSSFSASGGYCYVLNTIGGTNE